jgi:hypothetical protein
LHYNAANDSTRYINNPGNVESRGCPKSLCKRILIYKHISWI